MPDPTPRYLVPFHPKRVPHHFTDVLVIGGGLAGLRAALAVDPRLASWSSPRTACCNRTATTPRGASPACSIRKIASRTTSPTRSCRGRLVRSGDRRNGGPRSSGADSRTDPLGNASTKNRAPGTGARRRAQPRSHRTRAGRRDRQGSDAGRDRAHQEPAEPEHLAEHLHARPAHARRSCRGALVWNESHGKTLVWAKQTILCTGGAGQVYRETTNPDVATGDGLRHGLSGRRRAARHGVHAVSSHGALHRRQQPQSDHRGHARRRGATWSIATAIASCPSTTSAPSWPRATWSAGRSSRRWKRRDIRTSISTCGISTPITCAAAFLASRPICAEFGIDITRDRIPVRPGAHYMIGGVTVDPGAIPRSPACGPPAK